MNALTDAGSGLVLALSFALVWQGRARAAWQVVAVQCAVVALVAAGQGAWPLAAGELAWAAAAALGPGLRRFRLPIWPAARHGWLSWGAAVVLVLASLPFGPRGPGLATALLGLLLVAIRPGANALPAGLVSLQAGAALAGLAEAGGQPLLAPLLPLVLLAASWPARGCVPSAAAPPLSTDRPAAEAPRRRRPRPAMLAAIAEFAACLALLLLAAALPWLALPAPWRADALGSLGAILIGLLATALRWPMAGRPVRLGGGAMTAGAMLALLAGPPALIWAGLAIAVLAATAGGALRARRLGGLGLGFALLGILAPTTLPGLACLLVGLACIGALAPELSVASLLLVLRLRSLTGPLPGLDALLLAAGLLALLAAVIGLAVSRPRSGVAALAMLGQAGVAVFALGLDSPASRFAAVLQVTLLALTRLAAELAPTGLPRLAALAGLAGVPPFGLFPSLALLLAATAARDALLLPPLLAGLGGLAWLLLRDLQAGGQRWQPALAWVPLAAVLLLGLLLPGPVAAGLQLVAGELR